MGQTNVGIVGPARRSRLDRMKAQGVWLRHARPDDEPFLLTILFYAAHADGEPGAAPSQLLANPALARYLVGFGRPARARQSHPGVSLSVRRDNPARRLYLRLGFEPVVQVTNRVGGISE